MSAVRAFDLRSERSPDLLAFRVLKNAEGQRSWTNGVARGEIVWLPTPARRPTVPSTNASSSRFDRERRPGRSKDQDGEPFVTTGMNSHPILVSGHRIKPKVGGPEESVVEVTGRIIRSFDGGRQAPIWTASSPIFPANTMADCYRPVLDSTARSSSFKIQLDYSTAGHLTKCTTLSPRWIEVVESAFKVVTGQTLAIAVRPKSQPLSLPFSDTPLFPLNLKQLEHYSDPLLHKTPFSVSLNQLDQLDRLQASLVAREGGGGSGGGADDDGQGWTVAGAEASLILVLVLVRRLRLSRPRLFRPPLLNTRRSR